MPVTYWQRQMPVVAAKRMVSVPVWGDARDPWSVSDSVLVSGIARIVVGCSDARLWE